MKVRKLSPTGDFLFGAPASEFLQNSPEAVAQVISTRLQLIQGEWFLDATEGLPQLIGRISQAQADANVRTVILDTQGVQDIAAFTSSLDPGTRKYSMSCTVNTIYGQASVTFPQ